MAKGKYYMACFRPGVSLMKTCFCLVVFLCVATPAYPGQYLNSAHGNNTYGVSRSATASAGYARGNCAHCHEQHASIKGSEPAPAGGSPSPYSLFYENFVDQTDGFCFKCHMGTGSLQTSFDRLNHNYSYCFGGDTVNHATPDNIYDAFNPAAGSSHNLKDVLDFVKAKWPGTFNNESNPCSACHNPHLSQRGYPIVRPTDRNNIWGDGPGEKMSDFAAAHGGQYQAPYRYNSNSTYEPDGSATTDGSNLPDYVTFCSDCHNATNVIYSTSLGRNVKPIDWTSQGRTVFPGDYHGAVTRCQGVNGSSARGSLKDPYYTANAANFILSCTDCHESHGAVNGLDSFGGADTTPYFLRKTVNGYYNGYTPTGPGPTYSWSNGFCQSCHVWVSHCGGPGGCLSCHYHNTGAGCWGPTPCNVHGIGHTF